MVLKEPLILTLVVENTSVTKQLGCAFQLPKLPEEREALSEGKSLIIGIIAKIYLFIQCMYATLIDTYQSQSKKIFIQ